MAARQENCAETIELEEILSTNVSLYENGTSAEHEIDLVSKDTEWAWMCCLGCFLQAAISCGGVTKCFGIMYVAFMEEFGSKAEDAAWILAISNGLLLFGGSFGAALSIQFTSRTVVCTGGLLFFVGYTTSMFATKVAHLYVTENLSKSNF